MNKFFSVLLTLAVLSVAMPSGAQGCTPTTSEPEATQAGFYVDVDFHRPGSIWIYQESNDIEGLQRGDSVKDDTCGGQIEADTVIF